MGSGGYGPYSGSKSGSQPYAPQYHVEESMQKIDMKYGVIKKGAYIKNPTAENLESKIVGEYIGNRKTDFIVPYVIDSEGNIIIGKRNGYGRGPDALPTPHPTLIGGKDPQVKVAGMLEVRGGKIYNYDNRSGHYKPHIKSMKAADEAFKKLPSNLFHKQYKKER